MSDTDTTAKIEAEPQHWAIVEIMGHRKHVGRIYEEERFGAKFLRVDVPVKGDPATHGWTSHFYSGGAIFSLTPTDEATALRANRPYAAASLYLTHDEDDSDIDRDDCPL